MERQIFDHRAIGNHNPCRVSAGVAHHAFHFRGGIHQFFQVFLRLVERFEFGDFFKRLRNADWLARNGRDQLGHFIHFIQGDVHHAAHVTNGGFGPQGAESDDLGDFIVAILMGAVGEHL